MKYLGNTLAEGQSYSAVSSDIFLMSEFSSFRAAIGVSSLGSKVRSASGESFSLPASATLGLGYGDVFGQRHGVEVLVDADCYFSGAFSAAAGASYTYNDMVSVRAGYRYGGDSVIPSFASVGAGVKLFGVRLDACTSGCGIPDCFRRLAAQEHILHRHRVFFLTPGRSRSITSSRFTG